MSSKKQNEREVLRDLDVREEDAESVKGGGCATGQHFPEVILTVKSKPKGPS